MQLNIMLSLFENEISAFAVKPVSSLKVVSSGRLETIAATNPGKVRLLCMRSNAKRRLLTFASGRLCHFLIIATI